MNTRKHKVAIMHIATGRYIIFWKNFYRACEKYFLPHHDKTYFVFTDHQEITPPHGRNIVKIHQENLGWPRNTLMRFRMFLNIEQQLKEFDYIFFLNSNMIPLTTIGDEILPTEKQGLMVTIHPGAYQKDRAGFPYETNPASTAFIPAEQGEYYFMGGFNGGRTKAVLQSYHDMFNNIQKDLEKGIIAVWHDESHLNKYILDKTPLIVTPEYGYPEGWTPPKPIKAKILILDKSKPKYGGHDYLRGVSNKKRGYLHHYLGRCKHYLAKIAQIILQKQSRRRR